MTDQPPMSSVAISSAVSIDMPQDWIRPDWRAPAAVHGFMTTRNGGFSVGAYGGAPSRARDGPPSAAHTGGMNVGVNCGDDPAVVARNRALLRSLLPSEPRWLHQVHGTRVLDLDDISIDPINIHKAMPDGLQADAVVTRRSSTICAIQVADCLPVLFCDADARVVAAAHAGWRGLAAGVLEQTVAAMGVPAGQVMAWIGPGIGPQHFEVGDEVRAAFLDADADAGQAFVPLPGSKWLADLPSLAKGRLRRHGVVNIHVHDECTVSDPERFYSFRRDRVTGRMAAFIWLAL